MDYETIVDFLNNCDKVSSIGNIKYLEEPEDIEDLAEAEHNSWSDWMRWMLASIVSDLQEVDSVNKYLVFDLPCMQRWMRQMKTPYVSLTEKEKESDRIEARKKLRIYRP